MPDVFSPRLDILPTAQQRLWPQLSQTPEHFVLYGGTAIALRLGHRQSVDFDFFSPKTFEPLTLLEGVPYLKGAEVRQSSANNLTVTVDRGGPVQLSFFGNFDLGQAAPAEVAEGPRIQVASLTDLAGMKAAVVTQRAEVRDYLDIHALLTKANISLPTMLAAGTIIYGSEFNPLVSLKAISFHDDPGLAKLSQEIRRCLIDAVKETDPHNLPVLDAVRSRAPKP
jgi:Nucleotidyl transferase AbiEii toxin, Type IV TA system